jgi:hypothetical protein
VVSLEEKALEIRDRDMENRMRMAYVSDKTWSTRPTSEADRNCRTMRTGQMCKQSNC